MIDIKFDFYTDSRGGDPDSHSPTLRKYHQLLWSKLLPNGKLFDLHDDKKGVYLYHKSEIGDFVLGSDAIVHSYRNQKRKRWLIDQIPQEVDHFFSHCSTIGSYSLFPNNRIGGQQTINAARGCNHLIDDRFDLTLECIRRFYLALPNPLNNTLTRYKNFFDLFETFSGYVHFFLLQDLIDNAGHVRFYLPFNEFKTPPVFQDTNDYLVYKQLVMKFVESRNNRILELTRS